MSTADKKDIKEQVNASKENFTLPSQSQLEYQESELAAFMHFGFNTFTGREWGTGEEDPEIFDPQNWDPDSMVKALKDAGFKRLILTAKHHDGFCLWFSKYTDHTVEHSPFGRDVLAELSASCTKYGLDMGLYLSPWDAHEPSYGYGEGHDEATDTNGDYNEFYLNQIKEICENPKYGRDGHFVEWWLDGAKGEGADAQEYNFDEWISTIKKYNPGINIFGAGVEGGIHWVGNENGYAPEPCWYTADTPDSKDHSKLITVPEGKYWSVPEADVSLYKGWFHHPGDKPKTPSELAYIYLNSVGRGSTLLLNFPPTQEGVFADDAFETLKSFSEAVSVLKTPICEYQPDASSLVDTQSFAISADPKAEIIWELPESKAFDLINISEDICYGQRVKEFSISIQFAGESDFTHIYHGTTIGHKRILLLDDQFRSRQAEKIKFQFKALQPEQPLILKNIFVSDLAKAWKHPQSAKPAPLPGVEPGDPEW